MQKQHKMNGDISCLMF